MARISPSDSPATILKLAAVLAAAVLLASSPSGIGNRIAGDGGIDPPIGQSPPRG